MNRRRPYLVVTSNAERAAAVGRLLRLAEASALEVLLAKDLSTRARTRLPSAVFIDAEDPDSPEACRRLRRTVPRSRCAIVVFGIDAGSAAFVAALEAGADDYWPFPFNEPVCRAYLRSILRRISNVPAEPARMSAGDIRLDPERCEVLVKGKAVRLRAKEFDILYHLATRRDVVVSRGELLKSVWGFDDYGNSRAIDFHIGQLRRRLGPCADRLETVPGLGYRLRAASSHNNLT